MFRLLNSGEKPSARDYFVAVAIGLLSLVSPLVLVPIGLFVSAATGAQVGDLVLGLPFRFGGLGLLFSLLIMLSIAAIIVFAPALVTWCLTRSKRLTGVTLAAAVIFAGGSRIAFHPLKPDYARLVEQDDRAEQAYHATAALTQPTFELRDPLPVQPYARVGTLVFRTLVINVPVSAKVEGDYVLAVHFWAANSGYDRYRTIRTPLVQGSRELLVQFDSTDPGIPCYYENSSTSRIEIIVSRMTSGWAIFGHGDRRRRKWVVTRMTFELPGLNAIHAASLKAYLPQRLDLPPRGACTSAGQR